MFGNVLTALPLILQQLLYIDNDVTEMSRSPELRGKTLAYLTELSDDVQVEAVVEMTLGANWPGSCIRTKEINHAEQLSSPAADIVLVFSPEAKINFTAFNPKIVWLFINGRREFWNGNKPRFDSRVYNVVDEGGGGGGIRVEEIFSISNEKEIRASRVLTFNSEEKKFTFVAPYIWIRRRNLDGVKIKAALASSTHSSTIEDYNDLNSTTGISIDLMRDIAGRFNCTFEYLVAPDRAFGSDVTGDGVFNGALGEVQAGRADIMATFTMVTLQRSHAVDFSKSLTSNSMLFVTSPALTANTENPNGMSFSRMVTPQSLAAAALSVALGMLLSMMIVRWMKEEKSVTLFSSPLIILGAIISQGTEHNVTSLSFRILLVTVLLNGFLLIQTFSAHLVSYLTVSDKTAKINTVQDIIDNGLRVYSRRGTSVFDSIKNAPSGSARRRIWTDQMSKDEARFVKDDNEELFNAVKEDPKGIGLTLEPVLGLWFKNNPGDVCRMKTTTDSKNDFAMAYKKRFPFGELFDFYFLRLEETGGLARLRSYWRTRREGPNALGQQKNCNRDADLMPVSLQSVSELFYVLFGGCFCALFLSALERFLIKRM